MSKNDDSDQVEENRQKLFEAALSHIPFDGWSRTSLRKAAADVGASEGEAELAYPGGAQDLVAYFIADADAKMVEALGKLNMSEMRVRDRIRTAVKARIEAITALREAERKAVVFLAMPLNAAFGLKCLAKTVDAMWRAVGDTSTDFAYYSKRAILAGVYSATIMYWLSDESEGFEESWAFLDRRIDDVMRFEKAKARFRGKDEDRPHLTDLLRRVRYPDQLRMKP